MRIILIFFFCFLSSALIAQNNSSIIGNWTIVSIIRDGFYYNFKKDSLSFSKEELTRPISGVQDTFQLKAYAEAMKTIASQFRFEFYHDSKFKFVMDSISFVVIGNYKDDPAKKVITFSNKRSIGLNDFDVTDRIKYKIVDDLLYLSIDDDDSEFELTMEKERIK